MPIVFDNFFLGPYTSARIPERDSRGPRWNDVPRAWALQSGTHQSNYWPQQFIFRTFDILNINLKDMDDIIFPLSWRYYILCMFIKNILTASRRQIIFHFQDLYGVWIMLRLLVSILWCFMIDMILLMRIVLCS